GVPLLEISQVTSIDLDVDGADEIDPSFRLIKGGGGALLREKIVAAASKRMVVIADETKWVDTLGEFPLPVEVTRFGSALTAQRIHEALRETGCAGHEVVLRISGKANEPVITDGGNYIIDAHAQRIPNAEALAGRLQGIAGVVEHGLFLGLATTVILGKAKGAEVKQR
ncbi:MAG TPA: ribose-5-phosphate isomerase RpiA, partial [Vitreimonas sp.]|nr:ribose-5-phosphate isomerase RpiA [Vitreimonas sp.]